ncbi:hypothetical protein J4401_04635 [Candidatus Woesearchaeota archaeon]|nr:hypothetical protein [Candidatus Woesearchaeota archaeon]
MSGGAYQSKYTTSVASLDVQESVVVNVPYTPSSADITNSKVTIKVEAELTLNSCFRDKDGHSRDTNQSWWV